MALNAEPKKNRLIGKRKFPVAKLLHRQWAASRQIIPAQSPFCVSGKRPVHEAEITDFERGKEKL